MYRLKFHVVNRVSDMSLRQLMFIVFLLLGAIAAAAPVTKDAAAATALKLETQAMKGDWDKIFERGTIRVVLPYSRSLFFNDRGTQMGLSADSIRELDGWLKKKYRTRARPITVLAMPATRDQLLANLRNGHAEIAIGNLTITAERQKNFDFTLPVWDNVSEIVVMKKGAPALANLDELAGVEVHVRKTSSYYESLRNLNERFRQAGRPQMKLTLVPDELEDEDMMEMVSAGLLRVIVVDDWKAKLWAVILPNIQLRPELALRTGAKIGWAIRKDTPKLKAVLNEFITEHLKGTQMAAIGLATYQRRFKALHNATVDHEWKKFENTIAFFEKYGEQYGFDHLMLAAQGYQESRLNQSARSRTGAIGIMQIMPKTGKELGVGDINKAEANVHGGTKYMRVLFDRNFKDANFDEQNRTLFAFASYNAGPSRIAKIRTEAKDQGLNPNKWFNNVEIVASKRIGQETVIYVRNIYKYYTAYSLQLDALAAQRLAKQRIEGKTATK
jgi:membrane-bound lytic murein transglycosylase MltF